VLVRIFSWRTILGGEGLLNQLLLDIGILSHPSSAFLYNETSLVITWANVWLPFMVLPIWAALERVPDSLLEASADLGARGLTTLRRVLLPMVIPGVAAGSIFTFSLTLGDFITPTLVGGAGSDFIGNVVYANVGVSSNVPFAAAFAVVPVIVMGIYLLLARRLGAFEAL
jgi:putative spermidine/putrescine transport system permease protein